MHVSAGNMWWIDDCQRTRKLHDCPHSRSERRKGVGRFHYCDTDRDPFTGRHLCTAHCVHRTFSLVKIKIDFAGKARS
jgi:hypothetical protein